MVNDYGNTSNKYITNDGSSNWESIVPRTVENDPELNGSGSGNSAYGSRALDINATEWAGMESGAILYNSTQSQDWLSVVPEKYKSVARKWENQQGVVKITPLQQRQKFTYSTVAYIASKQEEPKTQIFPVSEVSVTPHQINFDFYDTTEGRVGVSNAVEKHMTVEFDVYLTDLLAQFWIFGGDNEYIMGVDALSKYYKSWSDAINDGDYLNFEYNLENTPEFADFRATFLQQHLGWVCRFTSHIFGVFQGVINEVNYSVSDGETFAKWHVKLEEAIFTSAYSTKGKKDESTEDSTSNGSTTSSGSGASQEDIDVNTS